MNTFTKLLISGIMSICGIHLIFLSTQIRWYGLDIGTKKLSVFIIFVIFCFILSSLFGSVVARSSIKKLSRALFSTFEKLTPLVFDSLLEKSLPILDRLHSTDTPITSISYLRSPLVIID